MSCVNIGTSLLPDYSCTLNSNHLEEPSTTAMIAMTWSGGDAQEKEDDNKPSNSAHSSANQSAVNIETVYIMGSQVDSPAAVPSTAGDKLHTVPGPEREEMVAPVRLGNTLDTPEGHMVDTFGSSNKPRSAEYGNKQNNSRSAKHIHVDQVTANPTLGQVKPRLPARPDPSTHLSVRSLSSPPLPTRPALSTALSTRPLPTP
jgi:hypothetical protein